MSWAPGTRQFQPDFSTGQAVVKEVSLLRRPDAISFPYTTAFCVGPNLVSDIPGGILKRPWRMRDVNNTILISRASDDGKKWIDENVLFTYSGAVITELDCAFDQAARPVLVAERPTGAGGASEIWLYWFKPILGDFIFEKIADGRTPRCVLDNPTEINDSDVLVFYIRDAANGVVYRQQRDAYAIEITTPVVGDIGNRFVEEVFRTDDFRVALITSRRTPAQGTYVLERIETALYPVLLRDIDQLKTNALIQGGELVLGVLLGPTQFEEMQASARPISGLLVVSISQITLFDVDQLKANNVIQSGTLVVVLISHTLFDLDQLEADNLIQSGTLVVIVISHTLFDIDQLKADNLVQSGTLA